MGVKDVPEKLEPVENGVTETEEDERDDGKEVIEEMDMDRKKVEDCKEVEGKTEVEVSKNDNAEEDEIVGESPDKNKEEDGDGEREEQEKLEEPKEEKGSKKRSRSRISAGKKDRSKRKEPKGEELEQRTPSEKKIKETKASVEKKKMEPKTPTTPTIERPVRERKSVERLVATIERDYSKELHVEKGRGTALKDIPNVAYKLSRKKTGDTFKLLHTVLFGRRAKAAQVKNNISRFSGFPWKDNEEKQMIKLKEKLDKCVKEKLAEFCDVLDIPISKANSRKEDIIATLIEFLLEPHATTSELLADKEQGTKRKRVSKSASGSSTQSKGSAKSRKKSKIASKNGGETKSRDPESAAESNEEKETSGVPEKSNNEEMSEQAESIRKESESEVESEVDKANKNRGSRKSSEKAKTKKTTISKKISPPPKKTPVKSPPSRWKNVHNDTSTKKSSGKKKEESIKKSSTPKKSASKGSSGRKILKVKDKLKEEASNPSDDELKNVVCEILKEVDFNTATFTDILKLLGKRFDMDLTPRKSSIKIMIQDELTIIANAADGGDADKKL